LLLDRPLTRAVEVTRGGDSGSKKESPGVATPPRIAIILRFQKILLLIAFGYSSSRDKGVLQKSPQ
jgi:hypothetical protein